MVVSADREGRYIRRCTESRRLERPCYGGFHFAVAGNEGGDLHRLGTCLACASKTRPRLCKSPPSPPPSER